MKNIVLLFLFLIPAFLFAQYPTQGNKSRLGYQTTGDGLIWRGVAADTAIKPRTTANAYFQLDTVNGVLRRYIATRGSWQTVSGGGGAGLTMPFDSITFNATTADPDTAELKYNADLETFVFGADGTIIEIGQKTAWYVKNQSGSTINKGTVVRAAGTLGSSGRILIEPMEIDGTVNSRYLLGITASNIANGSDGYVIHFGKLRKFNTSSWSDGAVLYADAAGGLTATEPSPPNLRLPIAFVVHSHATNGVLAVRIQTGNMLDELHDVDTTGIVSGGTLVWDEALSKWKAAAPDYDRDSTNEIQTLSFAQPNLFISDGNSVDLSPLLNGYVSGTGTSNLLPKWQSSTTLTNSNVQDNGTAVSILNNKPFQLGQWTTAGRPTGVNGYGGFNTSTNWVEYYSSTGWFSPLQSSLTGGLGSTGRVLYTDANGRATDSGNLTYTGTRFQTGGSIRIGYNNVANDTASIEKVIETNSKVMRLNSPGGSGGFNGGFVFRGGQNGTVATVNTFRMYTNSTSLPGSVYIGNVTEPSAQSANATTVFGILNKITSSTSYDAAINIHANETGGGANYSLALGKQIGIQIGNNYSNTNFQNFTTSGFFGVFIGYQRQPLTSGYGSSMVLSAHGEGASTTTEVMRLQGKDGNICLGCTNAQYQLYTSNTGAYGIPSGTVAQRPTIIASTSPIRFNTDSTSLEYGESVGVWRQLATRAYARSLVSSLPTTNIYTANGSLTSNRTLTGGTYDLALNTDVTIGDSLKVTSLPQHETGYIVTEKNGWIGRSKFLLPNYSDSLYTFNVGGFFNDRYASGFMSAGATNTSLFYSDSTGYNEISNRNTVTGITSGIYLGVPNGVRYLTLRQAKNGRLADFAFGPAGFDYTTSGIQYILRADSFGIIQMAKYGNGIITPSYTGSTRSNYIAQFATNGTILDLEQKRDTTVYVVDTDLDWSAAITTAQIASRYNRVIFLLTTTGAAGSNSDLTLHTPDANLMQVEYLIRSTDEAGGFTNTIQFGSNNAVQSDNTLTGTYTPAAGQGVGIRAGLRSGVYKYFYY